MFFSCWACSSRQEQKPTTVENTPALNIDSLLQAGDPLSVIMQLDSRANQLSHYGEDVSGLTEPQKVLLYVENLEREINNGGFNQFYWNTSGNYALETVDGLKAIRALKMAEIVIKAHAEWPTETIPKDQTERQEMLEKIEDRAKTVWEQCDQEFYQYPDNIESLLFEYIKHHRVEFQ